MQRCDFKCGSNQFIKNDSTTAENGANKIPMSNEKLYDYSECDDSSPFSSDAAPSLQTKYPMLERPYRCDICDRGFKRLDHLKRHNTVHTGEKAFKCDCGKAFTRQDKLKVHKETHMLDKPYRCEAAHFNGSVYVKNSNLALPKPFKCHICDKGFLNAHHMKRHLYIHRDKPYKCDRCPKSFITEDKFKSHQNHHAEKKPMKGELCEQPIYQHSNFAAAHARNLFPNKHFEGNIDLGKNLNVHFHTHNHSHSGEKPFQCKDCSAQFTFQGILNDHIEVYHNMLKGIPMQAQQAV